MEEVISLVTRRQRRAARSVAVAQAVLQLDQMHDALINLAMRVALRGVWTQWDAQTPDGTKIELGPDTFVGCGDPVAEMLGLLAGQIQDRRAEIARVEAKPQSSR